MYMYNIIYIITLHAFLFGNVTKHKLNDKAFKICLYFDSLQFFYGLTSKGKV